MTFGEKYIVVFCGMEICPLRFYSRVEAQRAAKALNRAGNYALYKAVKYRTHISGKYLKNRY